MDAADVESDLVEVLYTEAQIQERLGELARQIEADYDGQGPAASSGSCAARSW